MCISRKLVKPLLGYKLGQESLFAVDSYPYLGVLYPVIYVMVTIDSEPHHKSIADRYTSNESIAGHTDNR
jgi:hypothetical protein